MTTYTEVREKVAGSSFTDWIQFPSKGTWTFQPDVDLRLSREEQLNANVQEPWTAQVQGTCTSYGYILYYRNSPVNYYTIVSVDDRRAHIPSPNPPQVPNGQYTITPFEETVGRIVTADSETFQAYVNTTGIAVEK